MKIAITGSSGFIGENLINYFKPLNNEIIKITREDFNSSIEKLIDKLNNVDVILNLAGASIDKRWNKNYKKTIFNSRILTTKKISDAIIKMENKPKLFISASAVGIYDDSIINDEENYSYSSSFLAEVCKKWENSALVTCNYVRTVILRFGIVLGNGGMLKKIVTPYKYGLGAKISNGKQNISWIHIKDLIEIFAFTIENTHVSGVLNATSPKYADNKNFSKTIAKTFNKPLLFTIPSFLIKLRFGEAAHIMLNGQKVYPKKLIEKGFKFQFPDLEMALQDIFKK